jgi:hypothetical protein
MNKSDRWVKVKGRRYLVTWSARGYWLCPELNAITEINKDDWSEQEIERAFNELVKEMRKSKK